MTKKVMAISSGGGHWVQLMRLTPVFDDWDVFYISLDKTSAQDVPGKRYYSISEASRKQKLRFLLVMVQLFRIFIKERPDVVVTTGSAPALVALAIGKKLFGCKTVWIDSIANAEQLSTSGSKAGKYADIWLTQWDHLADKENGLEHWGAVL